jgi:hypothetical protein
LAKRGGLLYLLQLGLVLLGLLVAYTVPGMWSSGFWPEGIEDWPHALEWATVLGANPIYINFLSSYVVILLAAIPMVYLLWTRHVAVVLTAAGAIYLVGLRFPDAFTLPNGPQSVAGFNNATWLTLFITGLVVGWNWERWNVTEALRSRAVSVFAATAWVLLLGFVLVDAFEPTQLASVNWLFDKNQMAPGRMVASWVFFVMLFWLATDVERQPWGWRIIRPMDVLGSRALDSVVILTVAAILLPAVTLQPSSGRLAQVAAMMVVVVCWAWANLRRRRSVARKAAVASKEWELVGS